MIYERLKANLSKQHFQQVHGHIILKLSVNNLRQVFTQKKKGNFKYESNDNHHQHHQEQHIN